MRLRLTAAGGWAALGSEVEDRALPAPNAPATLLPFARSAPLEVTTANALRVTDAYACVRVLADSISSLPLHVYRRTAAGRVPAGKDSRAVALLTRPSPGSTGVDLISQVMVHLTVHGDAFVGKYRSDAEIVQLGCIPPDSVEVELLALATRAFGDVPLRDLERMSGEIATWQARLRERSRDGVVQALRQTLGAAVRWGYMGTNPALLAGRNRQPAPRTVRAFTRAELDAIAAEMPPTYAAVPFFAAATGLRPEEWQALERRDIDRRAGVLNVLRTVSGGVVDELGKTSGTRRQVPLTRRALTALDAIPPRLDTPLIFPAPQGGVLNLDNWRRRVWSPAIEASGVARPARIYDLRSTFASDALAANVSVFELARIMGTSVRMIEKHYGALLGGASASIACRLDALDDERDAGRREGPVRAGS